MDHDKLGAIASTGFKSYAVDTTFVSLDAVRLLDVTGAGCMNYKFVSYPSELGCVFHCDVDI